MEIEKYIESIQESCNNFIKQNLEFILVQLEKNKISLDNLFSENPIVDIDENSCGVYVFYIKPNEKIDTYESLKDFWESNKLRSPKVIKSRFKSLKIGESTCFYVGKSENLPHRIKQHINQQTNESTYGLKLSEHDRINSVSTFEYSFFKVCAKPNDENKDGLKCLLVTLEKCLREKLEPLIGKQ